MWSLSIFPLLGLLTPLASSNPTQPTFKQRCESLANSLSISPSTPITVNMATYLPQGSQIDHTAEGLNETCNESYSTAPPLPVSICRLQLTVKTSPSSQIVMETWLPEEWSGRFLSTGNGGFAGCIQYPDIAYGTSYGFATVGTDNGHTGTSGGAFFHQPEVLEDFVYRALYTGATVGKSITAQFYGEEHKKSYYFGCSTGGRQGWKAVQDFPELFDGVVAGAPAIDFNGLISWGGYAFSVLGQEANNSILTRGDWEKVHEAVLEQCDGLDGAADCIVEDTRQCRPDFSAYSCEKGASDWCLSSAQLDAIHKLFTPFVINGTIIHSGAAHGDELRLVDAIYGPLLGTWVNEWHRFVTYEDLSWDSSQWTLDDAIATMTKNPFNIQTYDGDISEFRSRGGKVLHYHGQADEYLSIKNSDRYYDLVASTLDSTPAELDDFYRYFRVSGMAHCFGGLGANAIGQGYGFNASNEPDDNVLLRIVEWVEEGKAPEVVRATKFVEDDPTKGVLFKRRTCKHPKVNKYFGSGNGTDEEGWRCVDGY